MRRWGGRSVAVLLGLDLLAAVADRFGLFGAPGAAGVSWGSWAEFVAYAETVTPWFGWPTLLAVDATVAECVLGCLLVAGPAWRWAGKLTAGLLTVYLVAMLTSVGVDETLGYAVPCLVGGALLASARGERRRTQPANGTSSRLSSPASAF